MRFSAMFLITGTLIACGGSQDPCKESVSVLQSESAKIKSCGGDTSQLDAEITNLEAEQTGCETALKSCTSADVSAYQAELNCEQDLIGTIQCKWSTEADPSSDPSYQAFQNSAAGCSAKADSVSAACRGED